MIFLERKVCLDYQTSRQSLTRRAFFSHSLVTDSVKLTNVVILVKGKHTHKYI